MIDYKQPIAVLESETEMIEEGSWGERDLGKHKWTMLLYDVEGEANRGYIDWDIPSIDLIEEIGLWYEQWGRQRRLIDYDGVMSLPAEAIQLLEKVGIIVDEDFR